MRDEEDEKLGFWPMELGSVDDDENIQINQMVIVVVQFALKFLTKGAVVMKPAMLVVRNYGNGPRGAAFFCAGHIVHLGLDLTKEVWQNSS